MLEDFFLSGGDFGGGVNIKTRWDHSRAGWCPRTVIQKIIGGGVVEDPNQKAQRDLPGLRQWANNLLSLATEILGKTQYSEKDHFGFMAFCFLSKQIDHMRAILALNESRDVGLIARSMLEGMCQLLWAAKDAETRALRWRTFAWIHDWRVMQGKILTGEVVDTERRTLIEEAVRQYGVLFLTEQARSNREKGKPLPKDPYHRNWTGKAAKEIFDSVEGKTLYLKLYKPFSDAIIGVPAD